MTESGRPAASPPAATPVEIELSPRLPYVLLGTLLVVEALKMETTVSAPKGGTISDVFVREGDVVAVGDALVAIA